MSPVFYLHEDEWGMISLEPLENLANRREVLARAAAHSEAHRAPDGVGWTAMFMAPAAPISIKNREITLDALAAVLGPTFAPYAKVTTGYSTYTESVTSGFAFGRESRDIVYGTFDGTMISELNITRVTRSMDEALHELGNRFRLVICDLWCKAAFDLSDRPELDRYLAHIDSAPDAL